MRSWLDCEVLCGFETCYLGFWESNLTILRNSGVAFSLRSCQWLTPKKMKISIFSQSFKNCYFIIKNLTKFNFYIILPVLKHYRTISADLRKPLDIEVMPQNHVFWTKSGKSWFGRSSYEEFLQIFFSKSSDDSEHFSYLWHILKMNTYSCRAQWSSSENRHFWLISPLKILPSGSRKRQ